MIALGRSLVVVTPTAMARFFWWVFVLENEILKWINFFLNIKFFPKFNGRPSIRMLMYLEVLSYHIALTVLVWLGDKVKIYICLHISALHKGSWFCRDEFLKFIYYIQNLNTNEISNFIYLIMLVCHPCLIFLIICHILLSYFP